MVLPLMLVEKASMQTANSNTAAPTAKGKSFFTVDLVIVIGATIAAQPTISSALKIFDPTTLPTAMSGVSFSADTKLTNNSGADVPAATMVSPITISGTFIRRASAEAPSVNRSAPHNTSATPTIINIQSKSILAAKVHKNYETTKCRGEKSKTGNSMYVQ